MTPPEVPLVPEVPLPPEVLLPPEVPVVLEVLFVPEVPAPVVPLVPPTPPLLLLLPVGAGEPLVVAPPGAAPPVAAVRAVVPLTTVAPTVATEAPVAAAASASVGAPSVRAPDGQRGRGRTRTEIHSDGDDLGWVDGWFFSGAHGRGAIANAKAKVHVLAEADVICLGTSQAFCLAQHVVDTCLLLSRQRTVVASMRHYM